jgi:hypothetical protein
MLSALNTRPLNMHPAPPAATRSLALRHSRSTSWSTTAGSSGMARTMRTVMSSATSCTTNLSIAFLS